MQIVSDLMQTLCKIVCKFDNSIIQRQFRLKYRLQHSAASLQKRILYYGHYSRYTSQRYRPYLEPVVAAEIRIALRGEYPPRTTPLIYSLLFTARNLGAHWGWAALPDPATARDPTSHFISIGLHTDAKRRTRRAIRALVCQSWGFSCTAALSSYKMCWRYDLNQLPDPGCNRHN